jgi:hypothetical protein
VLHPPSGIWLAGSVRFSTWLNWFQKIGHLAKMVAGQPEPKPQEVKGEKNLHGVKTVLIVVL